MPEHTGLLGALSHDGLASRLHDARPHEVTLLAERGVEHAIPIILEVLKSLEDFFFCLRCGGQVLHDSDQVIDLVPFEPLTPRPSMPFAGRFLRIEEGGQIVDVLKGVIQITGSRPPRESGCESLPISNEYSILARM